MLDMAFKPCISPYNMGNKHKFGYYAINAYLYSNTGCKKKSSQPIEIITKTCLFK